MEALIDQDPDFAATVEEIRKEIGLDPDYPEKLLAFKQELFAGFQQVADSQQDTGDEEGRSGSSRMWLLLVAGFVFVGLIVFLWLSRTVATCGLDDIPRIAKQAGLFTPKVQTMGAERPGAAPTDAFELYQSGSYLAAATALENLLTYEQDPFTREQAMMCLAVAQLMNERPALSLQYLDSVRTFSDPMYQREEPWYRALAFLMEGDRVDAATLLRAMEQNPNSPHMKDAQDLTGCL